MSYQGFSSPLKLRSWTEVRKGDFEKNQRGEIVENLSGNKNSRGSMISLGNFDGVHCGHRKILETLVLESHRSNLDPILLTFEPHPRYYFRPDEKPSLLTTPREKIELLQAWPIEVIPLAFDKALAELEPEDFITHFLQERLQGERFLFGHDHRFGKGARGDLALMRKMIPNPDENVLMLPPLKMDGEVVSSSAIRMALDSADIVKVNGLLGRPFSYMGQVIRGDGRGTILGFPTANLDLGYSNKAVVAYGVYGGRAFLKSTGEEFIAIANIGRTPTFAGQEQKIEVHLLNFDGHLYDQELRFDLHFHIRPEIKFPSIEALKHQIGQDITKLHQMIGQNGFEKL